MTSLSTMLQMGEKLKNQRCQAEGCTKNRAGMSPLCNGHQLKKVRYGHTHGRSIPRGAYKLELNEVREFFREHPSHPAILAASMFFQRWMEEAGRQEAEVGQSILVRLHGHAIPALDILAEVSALWVYAHRNPHALPDDQRLTFALTRSAIRLAGFEKKAYGDTKRRTMKHPRAADLKATGERIRQTLARYFVNLTFAIEAQADEAKAIKTNLATPFI